MIAALEAHLCVKTKLYRLPNVVLTMTQPYAGTLWSVAIRTIGMSGNVCIVMQPDGT